MGFNSDFKGLKMYCRKKMCL